MPKHKASKFAFQWDETLPPPPKMPRLESAKVSQQQVRRQAPVASAEQLTEVPDDKRDSTGQPIGFAPMDHTVVIVPTKDFFPSAPPPKCFAPAAGGSQLVLFDNPHRKELRVSITKHESFAAGYYLSGAQGVGKSHNLVLLVRDLRQQGHVVLYCGSLQWWIKDPEFHLGEMMHSALKAAAKAAADEAAKRGGPVYPRPPPESVVIVSIDELRRFGSPVLASDESDEEFFRRHLEHFEEWEPKVQTFVELKHVKNGRAGHLVVAVDDVLCLMERFLREQIAVLARECASRGKSVVMVAEQDHQYCEPLKGCTANESRVHRMLWLLPFHSYVLSGSVNSGAPTERYFFGKLEQLPVPLPPALVPLALAASPESLADALRTFVARPSRVAEFREVPPADLHVMVNGSKILLPAKPLEQIRRATWLLPLELRLLGEALSSAAQSIGSARLVEDAVAAYGARRCSEIKAVIRRDVDFGNMFKRDSWYDALRAVLSSKRISSPPFVDHDRQFLVSSGASPSGLCFLCPTAEKACAEKLPCWGVRFESYCRKLISMHQQDPLFTDDRIGQSYREKRNCGWGRDSYALQCHCRYWQNEPLELMTVLPNEVPQCNTRMYYFLWHNDRSMIDFVVFDRLPTPGEQRSMAVRLIFGNYCGSVYKRNVDSAAMRKFVSSLRSAVKERFPQAQCHFLWVSPAKETQLEESCRAGCTEVQLRSSSPASPLWGAWVSTCSLYDVERPTGCIMEHDGFALSEHFFLISDWRFTSL